jgi:ribose transport system substrate-binding protein
MAVVGTVAPIWAGANQKSEAQSNTAGTIKIGLAQATLASPFYATMSASAEALAKKDGVSLTAVDGNGDVTTQNNQVENLIQSGIKVLIINPVSPTGIAPSLALAKSAGIPVISVDRLVPSGTPLYSEVTVTVARNDIAMAKQVGEVAVKTLEPKGGTIFEIQGDAGDIVTIDRTLGFKEAVAGHSNIKLVIGPNCNYVRADAVTAMQNEIEAHPNIAAVYAENDDMGMGALKVLTADHKTSVKLFSIDGLTQALTQIRHGGQYVATNLNSPQYEAQLSVEAALRLVHHQPVPKSIDAGNLLITKANVSRYITSAPFASYSPPVKW